MYNCTKQKKKKSIYKLFNINTHYFSPPNKDIFAIFRHTPHPYATP